MFIHESVDLAQLKRKNTEEGRRYETPSGALYPVSYTHLTLPTTEAV